MPAEGRDERCEVEGIAVISAKNHKRQRRKRQSVTAKREQSQRPKVFTAILTLPNLGSCLKRQKPQARTLQAPIRNNRQTRKVANA